VDGGVDARSYGRGEPDGLRGGTSGLHEPGPLLGLQGQIPYCAGHQPSRDMISLSPDRTSMTDRTTKTPSELVALCGAGCTDGSLACQTAMLQFKLRTRHCFTVYHALTTRILRPRPSARGESLLEVKGTCRFCRHGGHGLAMVCPNLAACANVSS
jgi:hypothetical protein